MAKNNSTKISKKARKNRNKKVRSVQSIKTMSGRATKRWAWEEPDKYPVIQKWIHPATGEIVDYDPFWLHTKEELLAQSR